MTRKSPTQLDLFVWADSRPKNVIDLVPALIKRLVHEPWPPAPKEGKLISFTRSRHRSTIDLKIPVRTGDDWNEVLCQGAEVRL